MHLSFEEEIKKAYCTPIHRISTRFNFQVCVFLFFLKKLSFFIHILKDYVTWSKQICIIVFPLCQLKPSKLIQNLCTWQSESADAIFQFKFLSVTILPQIRFWTLKALVFKDYKMKLKLIRICKTEHHILFSFTIWLFVFYLQPTCQRLILLEAV